MVEKKLTLQDFDDLSLQIKTIFSLLEKQLAIIEKKFNMIELDFMYGNITEEFYLEKMLHVVEDVSKIKHKLEKIQDMETNSI